MIANVVFCVLPQPFLKAIHIIDHYCDEHKMLEVSNTVKTRLCVISDTHTHGPMPHSCDGFAYRQPLPKADVLLHAGDITMTGRVSEYEKMLDVLKSTEAELKIVIAGNHDITLDKSFYDDIGGALFHRSQPEDLDRVKEIWTGSEAKEAGIIYLEEGTNSFMLNNGATFTVRCDVSLYSYELLCPFIPK